jgi:hypothetical protein
MRGLYKIAGIIIDFEYLFSEHFKDQIKQFEVFNEAPDHFMKVMIKSHLEKPLNKPSTIYKNRYLYQSGNLEVLCVFHPETQEVTHFLEYDKEYKHILITLNESLKERLPDLEYLLTGLFFYEICILHGHMTLHASAVEYQNQVLLFSAPSQTGKSTLSSWWKLAYPESLIINDDKPIIMNNNGHFEVASSPWSGKTHQSINHIKPCYAILFLEQASVNEFVPLESVKKITHLFRNIFRPREEFGINIASDTINLLMEDCIIAKYKCINDISAAKMLHEILFKEEQSCE